MSEKVPCKKCGAMILPRTAEKTGGLCMPCYNKIVTTNIDIKKSSKQDQLEICYPNESSYFPVEAKEIICVGIKQEGTSGLMGAALADGMIDDLIPGFSTLPHCNSTSHEAQTPQEASAFIIKKGQEKNLNTIVIPSVDIAPQISSMMGFGRFQYAIGILTSVPEGKERQIFIIEGVGKSSEAAVRKVIRIKKEGAK